MSEVSASVGALVLGVGAVADAVAHEAARDAPDAGAAVELSVWLAVANNVVVLCHVGRSNVVAWRFHFIVDAAGGSCCSNVVHAAEILPTHLLVLVPAVGTVLVAVAHPRLVQTHDVLVRRHWRAHELLSARSHVADQALVGVSVAVDLVAPVLTVVGTVAPPPKRHASGTVGARHEIRAATVVFGGAVSLY